MNTSTKRIVEILNARRVREGHYRCRCPVHEGDSDTSLSISQGEDGRALVHCFGGCSPEDILETVGMKVADLFNGRRSDPDPKAEREREAWANLEKWRQQDLTDTARLIRAVEQMYWQAHDTLVEHGFNSFEFESFLGLTEEEYDDCLEILSLCARFLPEVEYRFDVLMRDDRTAHLELWRESGRPRVTA